MKRNNGNIRKSIQKLKHKLLAISDQPKKVALGYALGVFLAASPFIGIKVFIAIGLTFLLKWNKIAAIIGVFHINPVTGPLFYGVSFFVGKSLMGADIVFDISSLNSINAILEILATNSVVFICLTLGGLILGIPLGILAYLFCYKLIRKSKASGLKGKLLITCK